ncbi:hypothetical protein ES705_17581 [subsurface metagenome]
MSELEIVKEGYIFGYKDGIKGRIFDKDNIGNWNFFDAVMFQKGYFMGYKDSGNKKSLVECMKSRIEKGEML